MSEAAATAPHQRQMRRRKQVNPHFKNFVENTSLHGIKYICDANKHWMKRAFWSIVVICFIISLFTIYRIKIDKWKENPMTIEIANTPQDISNLPYPAFTICGPLRIKDKRVKYIMKKHADRIYKIADILGMPRKAFNEVFHMISTGNGTNSNGNKFVISDLSLENFFRHNSMYDYFSFLTLIDGTIDRRQTFMFRGLCLSCNILPPSKIYKMNTVRNFLRNDLIPKSRKKFNLTITFQLDNETINGFPSFTRNLSKNGSFFPPLKLPVSVNETPFIAFPNDLYQWRKDIKFIGRDKLRFTIHNPWEVPSPFMRWHRFQPFKDSRILIDPELIIKYPVDDNDFLYKVPYAKQCCNTTEKTLDFFQYYTWQNCLMECSTKRALKECGCVLFFMPHNESTYICSDEYSSCAFNVAKATHYDTGERKFVDSCDCLPSCNYTDYKVISYESFRGIMVSDKESNYQKIEISFRNDFFHSKVRTFTYNNNDMMDATVFYLDAFLGVSIMTVAEIFYYILLYAIDYVKSKIQRMFDGLYMS